MKPIQALPTSYPPLRIGARLKELKHLPSLHWDGIRRIRVWRRRLSSSKMNSSDRLLEMCIDLTLLVGRLECERGVGWEERDDLEEECLKTSAKLAIGCGSWNARQQHRRVDGWRRECGIRSEHQEPRMWLRSW